MFFCVQYLCSNMTVTEDNTCGLVIVSLVSALPSIAFLQVFNCNCFFQVLLVNQSLFSSSHAQSIAFSTQAPWSPAQLATFFSNYKTNTNFSTRTNTKYLFKCHCQGQAMQMWVYKGEEGGDYIAASAVIESPFAGALVNFRELRGWEETLGRVRHSIHQTILIFNLQISSWQMS